MAFYTMRHVEDRGIYGQRHCYRSEDGRLFVEVTRSTRVPALVLDVTYHDARGGGWRWFDPTVTWEARRDESGYSYMRMFVSERADLRRATPENERALVAEAAAMYRDGVRHYKASGWTPCEVTPDCLAD